MTIDLFLLIIWIICGVFTFASAKDHKVSVWSYACCWTVLIVQLISKL